MQTQFSKKILINNLINTNLINTVFFFLLVATTVGLVHCGGSATGSTSSVSTPVEIPAPVAHLTLSSPDDDGNVRITAAPNYADAGTTVSISAPSTSSSISALSKNKNSENKNLLHAMQTTATITVTVSADGSFQTEIAAAIADELTITYTLSGTLSFTKYSVPERVPPFSLDLNLLDVSVDPTLDQGTVLAVDTSDATLFIVNLSDGSIADAFTLSGASTVSRLATNPKSGYHYILDADNDLIWEINPNDVTASSFALSNIVDLETSTTSNYLIVSRSSGTDAITYYDPSFGTTTAIGVATNTGATHVSSSFVDTGFDSVNDILAVVSLMSDGAYYISSYNAPDSTSIVQSSSTLLTGLTTPGGMALFSDGSEALVTDQDNDTVLRINLSTNDITEISVGDTPLGVAIDTNNTTAYVVNSADDTVAVIDLATNTVSSTPFVGIAPTEIASDNAGILVINTGDVTGLVF